MPFGVMGRIFKRKSSNASIDINANVTSVRRRLSFEEPEKVKKPKPWYLKIWKRSKDLPLIGPIRKSLKRKSKENDDPTEVLPDNFVQDTTVEVPQNEKLPSIEVTRRTVVVTAPKLAIHRLSEISSQSEKQILGEDIDKLLEELSPYTNPNESLKNFPNTSTIGKGAYGLVFKADDIRMARTVAMKRINLTKQPAHTVLSEVKFLKDPLLKHKNLVELFSCFTWTTSRVARLWMVMELMDCTLSDLIGTLLTEGQMAAILREVLCGLSFLHSNVRFLVLLLLVNLMHILTELHSPRHQKR